MKKRILVTLLVICIMFPTTTWGSVPITQMTETVDNQIIEEMKDNFVEINSEAAHNLLILTYCLGKTPDEISKYIDFSQADKAADGKGATYEFKECDIDYFTNMAGTGTEIWHFDDSDRLNYIDISFEFAGDGTSFHTAETLEQVFGEYTENTNREIGITHYYWDKLPDISVTETYNFNGDDGNQDDGIVALNVNLAYKNNEQKSVDNDNTSINESSTSAPSETTEIPTQEPTASGNSISNPEIVKAVQTILNFWGFECGTPDGVIGNQTREAIKAYQKDQGLPETGEITSEIIDRLQAGVPLSVFNKRYDEAIMFWNENGALIFNDSTVAPLKYADFNDTDERYQPNDNLIIYLNPNVKDRKMIGNINIGSEFDNGYSTHLSMEEIFATFYAFDVTLPKPVDAVDLFNEMADACKAEGAYSDPNSGITYDNYSGNGRILFKATYDSFEGTSLSTDYIN